LTSLKPLDRDIDPFANDPGHWGASAATLAELMLACLNAARPGSVAEVGAYAGDLTSLLLEWAAPSGAEVIAIDPAPEPELVELDQRHENLTLIRKTSIDALAELPPPDAVFIDGDHNWYTVTQELRIIAARAGEGELPLLLFHDVAWPHARRDDYFDPEQIPAECRQPFTRGAGLFPGVRGIRPGGLPYRAAAQHEGGPRNGVLTAIEDFMAEREGLRLAIVPAFFGLGVLWREDAYFADAVAEVLRPWDGNPVLERLEVNRVTHLASSHFQLTELGKERERRARQELVLRRLLDSSAFALAERLSSLRLKIGIGKRHAQVSKDEVRRVLGD
jgi:predicted O-methyltransferase YrrM